MAFICGAIIVQCWLVFVDGEANLHNI